MCVVCNSNRSLLPSTHTHIGHTIRPTSLLLYTIDRFWSCSARFDTGHPRNIYRNRATGAGVGLFGLKSHGCRPVSGAEVNKFEHCSSVSNRRASRSYNGDHGDSVRQEKG